MKSVENALSLSNLIQTTKNRIIGNIPFKNFIKTFKTYVGISEEKNTEEKNMGNDFKYEGNKYSIVVKGNEKGEIISIDIKLSNITDYEEGNKLCNELYKMLDNIVIGNINNFDEEKLEKMFKETIMLSSYSDFKDFLKNIGCSIEELEDHNVKKEEFDEFYDGFIVSLGDVKYKIKVAKDLSGKGRIASISIDGGDKLKLFKLILSNKEYLGVREEEMEKAIKDLLQKRNYKDFENYLKNFKNVKNVNIKAKLNGELNSYYEINIYGLSLKIWEDALGNGTIYDVIFESKADCHSLIKLHKLLRSFKEQE